MSSNSKEKTDNYRILWVDDDQNKHYVSSFFAETDDDAYTKLCEYNSAHDDHDYYYSKIKYITYVEDDGSKHTIPCCDNAEAMQRSLLCHDSSNVLKRLVESVRDFFITWFYEKPVDFLYWIKDIAYLIKYGERRSNQWNLDSHLVSSIIRNVPSLIRYSNALLFIDEAMIQLHKNEAGFDLNTYRAKNNYTAEEENLALKIQNDELNKLLLHAKLYQYYLDFGIIDSNNSDEIYFDQMFRHTLPVKPGTYDEFDYNKLNEMIMAEWNAIWDWIKLYGQRLWD